MNKVELSEVVKQLEFFECKPRDAAVYIQCLQLGPATVKEIAEKLDQHRVTVHSAISRLQKVGLITESRKGRTRLVIAEKPGVLRRLHQRKVNELKVVENNLDYVEKLLSTIQPANQIRPDVRFYEGVDGFKAMLEETLSTKGEVLVYSNVELLSRLANPEYLEDYFRRRAAKGIHTRLIFPPVPYAKRVNKKAEEYKIQIRILPPEFQWKSAIFAWDNCISLKSFSLGQLTCTIIENPDIAHFFRTVIFELSWRQAKPIDA